jgi:hypothetical protein
MVHGNDEDEEDLDETEVVFAMQDYAEDRQQPTPEAIAYAEMWRAEAAAEAAAAAEAEAEAAKVEVEVEEAEAAAGGAPPPAVLSTSRASSPKPTSAARPASRHRLWQSVEARERFRACLRQARSPALVSLAAKSFRAHCAAFGTLGWRPARGKGDEETHLALSAWVHADAFTGDEGKRRKK